jgi:carboxylesterase
MSQRPILDSAPFLLAGGPVGVLLVHGFTGSPTEMRLVGTYLHERGLTVAAPCLPGHGTTVADLNQMRWRDWAAHVARAYDDLHHHCASVFVGGMSMSALLSLDLAAHRPDLAGVILYSPAIMVTDRRSYLLPVLKYVLRQLPKPADHFTDAQAHARLWTYDAYPVAAAYEAMKLIGHVKRLLPAVQCPLLVMQSTIDHTAHPERTLHL